MPRTQEEIKRAVADVDAWLDKLDPSQFQDAAPLRRIAELHRIIAEAGTELAFAVRDARRAGFSWAMIGTMLGVSRQTAQQRFGHLDIGS